MTPRYTIYCFGKGPTETTVTATPEVITEGGSVLIKGTVMDISPGTKQNGVVERFPKGLPAAADGDMKAWMEYVYMQQPRPDKVEGVKVKLYAINEKGTSVYIGETTTDPLNGGIFSFSWSPQQPGTYTITALFEGSESYWRSYSSTAVTVTPAPPPAPAPATPEQVSTVQATVEALQPLITTLIIIVIICLILVTYDIYINRKTLKQTTK
jgi:hypothetical protein